VDESGAFTLPFDMDSDGIVGKIDKKGHKYSSPAFAPVRWRAVVIREIASTGRKPLRGPTVPSPGREAFFCDVYATDSDGDWICSP
jgi:hypothetical protein